MNIDFDDEELRDSHRADKTSSRAGRDQKGDVLIEMKRTASATAAVDLESSVKALFGTQITALVHSALQQMGVSQVDVSIIDNGALDFVIQARLEAAARQLCTVQEPGILPCLAAERPKIKDRLRRTRLYLPGNNPDLMLNAGLFGPDCVILDLEDSVAPDEKPAARLLVRNALLAVDFGASEKIVRINPLSTSYGNADLAMIVPACPDVILIPKCESAGDVSGVEEIVAAMEQKHHLNEPVLLMPLIESAKGVLNAGSIAKASSRTVALCFGAEDFAADLGVERKGSENVTARSIICMTARAVKIQALDSVYSDIEDMAGLQTSGRASFQMGFDGMGVIHPRQIKPIHDLLAPTPEQIDHARKILEAFDKARAEGSGLATVGTKMIDAPVVARAKKVLAMAEKNTD